MLQFDLWRDIGQRSEHPHEFGDFALGSILGTLHDFAEVFGSQMRAKQQQARHVKLPGADVLE